jgi:hypothetical protein
VALAGKRSFDNWTVQFLQDYNYSADPLVETGSQTSQQIYLTTLDVTHQLSQHVLFDSSVSQDLQYAIGYPSSFEWSNQDWLHYKFTPRIDMAAGGTLGYVEVTEGSNSVFLNPEVQVSLQPSDKIWLTLSGGIEHREYYGNASPSLNSPTFDGSIRYAPNDTTNLSLTGSRQVANSFFIDQTTVTTEWTASVQQRLLTHFEFTGSIGQSVTAYQASNLELATVRNDQQLFYSARLSTTFRRRGTIAVVYQGSRNSSSIPGFGYASNQYGVEIGFRY